jgi:hypothetical protein
VASSAIAVRCKRGQVLHRERDQIDALFQVTSQHTAHARIVTYVRALGCERHSAVRAENTERVDNADAHAERVAAVAADGDCTAHTEHHTDVC